MEVPYVKYMVAKRYNCGKIYTVHPCRNAAFGLSHDTFFYSVG